MIDAETIRFEHRCEGPPRNDAPEIPSAALFVPLCGLVLSILFGILGFGLRWALLALFVIGPGLAVLVLALAVCGNRLR